MKKHLLPFIGIMIFGLAAGLPSLYAHGGHPQKSEPEEQSAAPGDNMYAVDPDRPPQEQGARDADESKHDDHPAAKPMHMDHAKQQVKHATHTWVSSAQNGYDVAVAVTIFAGLAFAALGCGSDCIFRTALRPKETNKNQ